MAKEEEEEEKAFCTSFSTPLTSFSRIEVRERRRKLNDASSSLLFFTFWASTDLASFSKKPHYLLFSSVILLFSIYGFCVQDVHRNEMSSRIRKSSYT